MIPLRYALEGRRRILGQEHLRTIASMHNLGVALAELHEVQEARELLEEAWLARAARLGELHPRSLASAQRLLPLLRAQDDALAARAMRGLWEVVHVECEGKGYDI